MNDQNENPLEDTSNDPEQPARDEVLGLPTDGQSRRTFLKAALIGSAGVAAAGAAAGAALTLGQSPSPLIRFIGDVTLSPNDPCDVCGSNTADPLVAEGTSGNPYTGDSSAFIWVKYIGVQAGTYSFNITPTPQPKGAKNCNSSSPWAFQDNGKGVGEVNAYLFANGSRNCLPSSLSGLPTPDFTSTTLPITVTLGTGPQDLLFQIHLKYCGGGGTTTTITGTLTPIDGTPGTPVSCNNQIHHS